MSTIMFFNLNFINFESNLEDYTKEAKDDKSMQNLDTIKIQIIFEVIA